MENFEECQNVLVKLRAIASKYDVQVLRQAFEKKSN